MDRPIYDLRTLMELLDKGHALRTRTANIIDFESYRRKAREFGANRFRSREVAGPETIPVG